ncbi:hypothetical protein [Micromonospora sp. NPDC048063]|uniref:hypothetical protein n=1 Tax=Micromonospora sp. NPDC048063 TaxID=3364256 RepID=UPI003719F548
MTRLPTRGSRTGNSPRHRAWRTPRDTDAAELLKTLAAPIYLRLLITAEPVDEATADQAVRITLAAARASALRLACASKPTAE